jgi:hypothetical protein
MSRNSKLTIADGTGSLPANTIFPDGPCTAIFTIDGGAANLEVTCHDPELIRSGQGDGAVWAIVDAAVVDTPQRFSSGTKVTGIRLVNIGGEGKLEVAWKN